MICAGTLHADGMDHGAKNTACQEGEAYLLPSDEKAAGRHQLDVSPANGSSLGNQEDQQQGYADAEQTDQGIHPRGQIQKQPYHTEATDEDIEAYRDLIGPKIDDAQRQKRRAHQR